MQAWCSRWSVPSTCRKVIRMIQLLCHPSSKWKSSAFVVVRRSSLINDMNLLSVWSDQNGQRTSAVANNGLNPIWNHLMQFSICIPELCLIRFTVKDNDKSNTDLGQYAIPFLSMQSGNLSLELTSSFYRSIPFRISPYASSEWT